MLFTFSFYLKIFLLLQKVLEIVVIKELVVWWYASLI